MSIEDIIKQSTLRLDQKIDLQNGFNTSPEMQSVDGNNFWRRQLEMLKDNSSLDVLQNNGSTQLVEIADVLGLNFFERIILATFEFRPSTSHFKDVYEFVDKGWVYANGRFPNLQECNESSMYKLYGLVIKDMIQDLLINGNIEIGVELNLNGVQFSEKPFASMVLTPLDIHKLKSKSVNVMQTEFKYIVRSRVNSVPTEIIEINNQLNSGKSLNEVLKYDQ